MKTGDVLNELLRKYNRLVPLKDNITGAFSAITNCYKNNGKIIIAGNGGSSADADHIVSELMKGFEAMRPLEDALKSNLKKTSHEQGKLLAEKLQQGLPAISLSAHTALVTAISNDLGGDYVFAQQVVGFGQKGDVLIALSTSGNSKNVVNALLVAKEKGLTTIGFSGQSGGEMKQWCDILINVPEHRTAYVQELHLPIYHTICMMVEIELFG